MRWVLPSSTVFRWSSNDDGDRKRKADADAAVVGWLAVAVEKLGLPPASAQQIMLDNKILPPELAPNDATSGGVLTDEERAPDTMPLNPGMAFAVPAAPAQIAQKASGIDATLDETFEEAARWARLALGGKA